MMNHIEHFHRRWVAVLLILAALTGTLPAQQPSLSSKETPAFNRRAGAVINPADQPINFIIPRQVQAGAAGNAQSPNFAVVVSAGQPAPLGISQSGNFIVSSGFLAGIPFPAPNQAPILAAIADQSVAESDSLDVAVSATDPEQNAIVLSVENLPGFGTFSDHGNGSGTIQFQPGYNDAGVYPNIRVIAIDNGAPPLADTTSFQLTVVNRNRAPVAMRDSLYTSEDSAATIAVLVNDHDADGDTLTISSVTQPQHGTVTVGTGDSLAHYTPAQDFFGNDSFRYVISDQHGGVDSATVFVSVTAVNDAPLITNLPDSVLIEVDSTVVLQLWDYVSDVETADSNLVYGFSVSNDSLNFAFDSSSGRLSLSADSGFGGAVLFTMLITDEGGASASDSLVAVVETLVGIEGPLGDQVPQQFTLEQNYPNPFNPSTTIRFALPEAAVVRLEIFNLLGQRVRDLTAAKGTAPWQPGWHDIQWDGRDDTGRRVSSGLYFYRLKAGTFVKTRKLTYLR